MPKLASTLADAYVKRLQTFERSRQKIENLFRSGYIAERDINLFYEGLYLRVVTSFEGFLEDLFLGLLTGAVTGASKVKTGLIIKNQRIARDTIIGTNRRNYIDWIPYEDVTLKRAKIYFIDGLPFTDLTTGELNNLKRMTTIRNVVAHQSTEAQQKFENQVLNGISLLPKERKPAGFLRSIYSSSPNQTRYEDIVNTSALIARKLCR